MKMTDVFKMAYAMELRGRDFYKEQDKMLKHPAIKSIFTQLVDMEEEHALYIKKQIKNLEDNKSVDPLPAEVELDLFTERKDQQKFDPAGLDSDLGDYSIVRMAYLVEKDFADFYSETAQNVSGEVKDILLTLAKWETGHAKALKNQLENIISRNALDLGFYPL